METVQEIEEFIAEETRKIEESQQSIDWARERLDVIRRIRVTQGIDYKADEFEVSVRFPRALLREQFLKPRHIARFVADSVKAWAEKAEAAR